MLHQTSHWIEIAGFAISALLLCRVLLLRLYRVYLFITLACTLDVLFNGVSLWLGGPSPAYDRLFIYSRFIYALVYPMAAWDVFEEIKAQVDKLRRLAIGRLISGLFFAVIFGLIMAAFIDTDNANGGSVVAFTLALVFWAGSTTASLAFLFTIHRVLRTQPMAKPSNTSVWMYYFGLSFLAEVIFCFLLIGMQGASETANDVLTIAFDSFSIALTSWCILRLRPAMSDLPSAPENVRL
jgi:hypothetical protein